MGKMFDHLRNFKLPSKKELMGAFSAFSKKEKKVFIILSVFLVFSTLYILEDINKMFMVYKPYRGGSIVEGIIGTPRFINPILSTSEADKDMVSLIYSGLMKKTGEGKIEPDLAADYIVSKDGLSYIFHLKDGIYFHDGKKVTADDILFTISEAKDPVIKSPRKTNWDGVNVNKIDEKTIEFALKQPYASFLEYTTIGILPEHIWKNTPIELSDYNVNPIGSGPYEVSGMKRKSSGIIDYYDLSPFNKYVFGKPYLKNLELRFYPGEKELITALEGGEITQAGSISPEKAEILKKLDFRIESTVLPRVFGLFFNQTQAPIFTDKHVIEAFDQAIDKNDIVKQVLKGYGTSIDNPIPPNMIEYQKINQGVNVSIENSRQNAVQILEKDGWKVSADGIREKTTKNKTGKPTKTRLKFSIYTGDAPELKQSAEMIKNDLLKVGADVTVKTFDIGNLNQSVIRPRKYDALFFGQIINRESDLYAFWHSSQRNDPGLNIAMYTSTKVDKILEDARKTLDEKSRIKKYAQFEDEIIKDIPAVFVYSPEFIYVVSKDLDGISIDHITSPSDRFLNIKNWYTETEGVWKIFSK